MFTSTLDIESIFTKPENLITTHIHCRQHALHTSKSSANLWVRLTSYEPPHHLLINRDSRPNNLIHISFVLFLLLISCNSCFGFNLFRVFVFMSVFVFDSIQSLRHVSSLARGMCSVACQWSVGHLYVLLLIEMYRNIVKINKHSTIISRNIKNRFKTFKWCSLFSMRL